MALYRIEEDEPLTAPALVAGLDGWVDAGNAATMAAEAISDGGSTLATFDSDALLDFRARRPTLEIEEGVMTRMEWPRLVLRRVRAGHRDVLVLTGPEPDFRWNEFRSDLVELSLHLGVVETVSLGAIPAVVPHTRRTPVMMTGAGRQVLDIDPPIPADHLQVPASAVNLIELYLAEHGIPSVGFWAQVPHYVAGPYHGGALALVQRVSAHLGVLFPVDRLAEEARQERIRLDEVVAGRPEARAYLDRLEAAEGEEIQLSGEGLAAEVERFLRERTRPSDNPFDEA